MENQVSWSWEDDFILHLTSNFLCFLHPSLILSPVQHPAKPMLDPQKRQQVVVAEVGGSNPLVVQVITGVTGYGC